MWRGEGRGEEEDEKQELQRDTVPLAYKVGNAMT